MLLNNSKKNRKYENRVFRDFFSKVVGYNRKIEFVSFSKFKGLS